jgi:hypothetical protein
MLNLKEASTKRNPHMNQSEPKSDLTAWLEQQWDKAVKDSETPDKELLEKYTFYDGLTTAYEFTIARLKNVPNPFLPSCLTYEDWDDSSEDNQPQVGDYGVVVRENAHGQEEIPFHIEQEEHTGLPVAVLNTQLYAKPEDDIEDGQYVSLFQLYLDGFELSRTGRKLMKTERDR